MKRYRKLYETYTGESLEKKIDRLERKVLGKKHPRRLIGSVRKRTHLCTVFMKRAASHYLPSIYKALRRKRDDKAAKKGA
jgi:hypothetical protein